MIPGIELLETPARQAAVEKETQHRPWPLPDEPWVMAQTWDNLLFAHYRVPAEELRRLVPPELELDEHDGDAWLGVTPFVVMGFRLRGLVPLPGLSTFPELNVRTYVTAEDKPGVWFFSLEATSLLAVEGARRNYVSQRLDGSDRRFQGSYQPSGGVFTAVPGSLEWFLTERYCLYTVDRGELRRAEIHHPPWALQAAEAEIETNTMAPAGISLSGRALCHFSELQDVLIWPLSPAG